MLSPPISNFKINQYFILKFRKIAYVVGPPWVKTHNKEPKRVLNVKHN
jgi:hypothetical protein